MNSKNWFVIVGGKEKGPFTTEEVLTKLKTKELSPFFYARTQDQSPMLISQIQDFQNWQNPSTASSNVTSSPTSNVSSSPSSSATNSPPPMPTFNSSYSRPLNCHEIDYRIVGDEMQYVEIELDPTETVVAEAGAMMYMTDQIEMNTIFGDGSKQSESQGLFGRVLGAGKRLITGESLFMTSFTHVGNGKKRVAFASPYPGKIIPIDLSVYDGKIICQKDSFLCAAKGVSIGIEFNKKIGAGLFGGEGFIMQKLEGDGLAFVHASGTVSQITLNAGESLKVDTGCLVGFTKTINYDIEFVKGIKSMFFGGEGICFARVTGPGSVWVQSLPFSRLAARVLAGATGSRKEEGSILGNFGNLLDGD